MSQCSSTSLGSCGLTVGMNMPPAPPGPMTRHWSKRGAGPAQAMPAINRANRFIFIRGICVSRRPSRVLSRGAVGVHLAGGRNAELLEHLRYRNFGRKPLDGGERLHVQNAEPEAAAVFLTDIFELPEVG